MDDIDRPSPTPGPGAPFEVRALSAEDSAAVFALMAAVQRDWTGEVDIEEADIVADWARPSHDLASSSVGVLVDGEMVGYAELIAPERYDAAVHPGWVGRGVGTWLAAWVRDLAAARGSTVVGMPVPVGSSGDAHLAGLGYFVRWTSWVLRLPPDAVVAGVDLPEGWSVGAARADELPAAHGVLEDAFADWANRARETWADFEAAILRRPGYEPWQIRVARTPGGDVVGAAVTMLTDAGSPGGAGAYVDRLGVAHAYRGRSLARALLADSFDAGREHGATSFELSTDSRTGALGLYERVGMSTHATWVHRAHLLTPS